MKVILLEKSTLCPSASGITSVNIGTKQFNLRNSPSKTYIGSLISNGSVNIVITVKIQSVVIHSVTV